jgi:uncharacterized integral membrane protein
MTRLPKWLPVALVVVPLLGLLVFVFSQVYTASNGQMGAVFWFRTYPGLIVALASGFFGATFSMLVQTHRRTAEGTLEDLSSACAWRTLIVRASVGLGGAAILYFFFRSGLLDGNLWPDLRELGYDPLASGGSDRIVPNQHWCLLVIWCFLAGFSETLVPNILTKTEQKASIS